jgi:PAS domain S-box-containing protein
LENIFNNRIIESYFYSRNGIITEINEEFLNFTGFKMNELLGKSLMEIGNMLRINSQIFQKEEKD